MIQLNDSRNQSTGVYIPKRNWSQLKGQLTNKMVGTHDRTERLLNQIYYKN